MPVDDLPAPVAAFVRQFFKVLAPERLQGFEHSFKLSPGVLARHRYLAGLSRRDLPPGSWRILCARLGMPTRFLADCEKHLAEADTLHFGVEAHAGGCVCKVYLESWERLNRAREQGGGMPVLLHLAYKWDVLNPAQGAVARYDCHPGLDISHMLARMEALYPAGSDRAGLALAREMLELAARTPGGAAPMYLEVREEGNPRVSFDLNLHAAELNLGAVESQVMRAAAHFGIAESDMRAFYAPLRTMALGHVAGGIARDGRDFFTIYHQSPGMDAWLN